MLLLKPLLSSVAASSVTREAPPPNITNNGSNNSNNLVYVTTKSNRRNFNLSLLILPHIITSTSMSLLSAMAADEAAAHQLDLEEYTDASEGFTLLRPSSWNKVDKAGATALFQDPSKGTNSLGVVVNPVRISSLGEFGTPEFVADKLIQAEKRKESTNDAVVVGVADRLGTRGLQVYEFEYKLDSTRGGMKRIFSAAFVASKKLYLLNITHSDAPENPLDAGTRMVLEQALHSFGTAPST